MAADALDRQSFGTPRNCASRAWALSLLASSPGLTRRSISLRKMLLPKRWMRGVAGASTRVFDALLPIHDGARLTSALRLHAAGSNIATVSVAGRNCVACR